MERKGVIPALSEVEELTFEELPDQKFESFITDGLSTLPETVRKVKFMEEKTIRWQGHVDQIKLLMDLGFFSERPVNLKTTGARVSPRGLLSTLLDKKLAMHQGDKDMTLMRVEVQGRKKKGDRATRIHQIRDDRPLRRGNPDHVHGSDHCLSLFHRWSDDTGRKNQ